MLSEGDNECFKDGSVLLILVPLKVEGKDISENFKFMVDWTPPKFNE